jgi:Zn-dependent M16 (insulinase) family peptidase
MAKETEAEKKRLAHVQSTMSPPERHQIVKLAKDLKLRQEQKQGIKIFLGIFSIFFDVNVLPTVTLGDIPKVTPKVEIRKKGEQIFWVPQPTNGMAFFRTLVPIPSIPSNLIPYIPLFTTVLAHTLPEI